MHSAVGKRCKALVEPHRRSFKALLATNHRRRAISRNDWLEIPDSGHSGTPELNSAAILTMR
jgi:hypothetical protein